MSGFYICNDPSRQQLDELYGESKKIPCGPYRDQLRLTRFSAVARLDYIAPSSVQQGDIVVYFDERGDILKQNGHPLVYVVSAAVDQTGTYRFKTVPFEEHSIYSAADPVPYTPIYIDPDKLATITLSIEAPEEPPQETNHHCTIEGCTCCVCTHAVGKCCDCEPRFRNFHVTAIEKEEHPETTGLEQLNDYLFLKADEESEPTKIPCPILKREVTVVPGNEEGKVSYQYRCTIQANQGTVWTIEKEAADGFLYISSNFES